MLFHHCGFSFGFYIFYFYIMLRILHIFILGAWFSQRAYAQELDPSRRTRGSSSRWSRHLALELHCQPTGWIIRFMDFIIDQLVGLFDAHFRSGIHFIADQIARCFGFIDSYAGDLPAMLRTPRRLDSSCKRC